MFTWRIAWDGLKAIQAELYCLNLHIPQQEGSRISSARYPLANGPHSLWTWAWKPTSCARPTLQPLVAEHLVSGLVSYPV